VVAVTTINACRIFVKKFRKNDLFEDRNGDGTEVLWVGCGWCPVAGLAEYQTRKLYFSVSGDLTEAQEEQRCILE
jgi:hypothetical protein